MDDWYKASDSKNDQLLDELMCEYVDGTMDPSVRSAFDELVNSSPEIAQQIRGLTEAQHFLKQTGCSLCAPRQFQSKLRARLNAETGKIDVYGIPPDVERRSSYRFAILATILLLSIVALPRHDYEQVPQSTPAVALESTFEAAGPAKQMTPARRPGNVDVGLLVSNSDPLYVSRPVRNKRYVPTAEAELTLLGD